MYASPFVDDNDRHGGFGAFDRYTERQGLVEGREEEEEDRIPTVKPVYAHPDKEGVIEFVPLEYHWGEERDHVLMGKDLFSVRSSLSRRFSLLCVLAAAIEIIPFAWTIVAFSVWGFSLQTIYTLVFAIHLLKALLLSFKWCTSTLTYKMHGRVSYHWFTGIWTRLSHVHQDPVLLFYGSIYGMIHVPLMLIFLVVSVASYPMYDSSVVYWITWPMAIVSLIVGYVTWCIIISEYGIRKPLRKYVDFTPEDRDRSKGEYFSRVSQDVSPTNPFAI